MNEIVYNILRKCVECPEKVEWEVTRFPHFYITFNNKLMVSFKEVHLKTGSGKITRYHGTNYPLTDKECRRIIRGMEHVQAMKIRNL